MFSIGFENRASSLPHPSLVLTALELQTELGAPSARSALHRLLLLLGRPIVRLLLFAALVVVDCCSAILLLFCCYC